jgi:hypothetical protein
MIKPGNRIRIYSLFVAVTATVLAVLLLHPATSPFAQFHDADGDGVADAYDIFPADALEWKDSDLDGIGDNGDVFPMDPSEWNDADHDGYGDNCDLFRNNPNEWNDTDEDGFGDNAQDLFPMDPSEWADSDMDGVGDNDDFKKNGNGMVQVSIERFGGWYEDYATLDKVDPYFQLTVSENSVNGSVFTNTTRVFLNTTHLLNNTACVFVYDIDDGADSINITVIVRDAAGETITADDRLIDYTRSAINNYVTYTVAEPFNIYRCNDGLPDNVSGEMDCEIGILVEQYPRAPQSQDSNVTETVKNVGYETQPFSGWMPNGTYSWIEGYYFIGDLNEWNRLFKESYNYNQSTDFVPDFRNYSYVLADWGMQNGLYTIQVVEMEIRNTTLNIYVEKVVPSVYWGQVTHIHHFVRISSSQLMYMNVTQAVFYEYKEITGFSTSSAVLFYMPI